MESIKPIFWTTRAKNDLEKILIFNTKLYNQEKAIQMILSLVEHSKILEKDENKFSKIGSIDEDFTHLKQSYRKLIHHHYKITYRVGKNKIYIVRVFDTRQHPSKNK